VKGQADWSWKGPNNPDKRFSQIKAASKKKAKKPKPIVAKYGYMQTQDLHMAYLARKKIG